MKLKVQWAVSLGETTSTRFARSALRRRGGFRRISVAKRPAPLRAKSSTDQDLGTTLPRAKRDLEAGTGPCRRRSQEEGTGTKENA